MNGLPMTNWFHEHAFAGTEIQNAMQRTLYILAAMCVMLRAVGPVVPGASEA